MTASEAFALLNDMEFAEKYQGKDEYTEMLLFCKNTLEKQIPKKVEKSYSYLDGQLVNYLCTNCGNAQGFKVNKRWQQFCPHCGQALDWSDTE